jgi:hypothetical protein
MPKTLYTEFVGIGVSKNNQYFTVTNNKKAFVLYLAKSNIINNN